MSIKGQHFMHIFFKNLFLMGKIGGVVYKLMD